MSTFNGIGLTLYGNKRLTNSEMTQYRVDNTAVIATKWFVFAGIPVVPLNSYIKVSEKKLNEYNYGVIFGEKKEYGLIKLPKLVWSQVLLTYLVIPLSIVLFIIFIIGMNFVYSKFGIAGIVVYIVLILVSIVAILLKREG